MRVNGDQVSINSQDKKITNAKGDIKANSPMNVLVAFKADDQLSIYLKHNDFSQEHELLKDIKIGNTLFKKGELPSNFDSVVKVYFESLLGVALLLIAKHFIIKIFSLNIEVENYLNFTLNILFYYIPLQSISAVLIVGVFRAGGDTKFALIADILPLWCGSVLISAFAAFYLNLPTKLIYFLIMSDEIIKQPLIIWRYRSKKWINNVTRELN